jgi:pimeloyl-ACP methyl ester carboxylesterase
MSIQRTIRRAPAIPARLAEITAPALVVMGEEDPDFPAPQAGADASAQHRLAELIGRLLLSGAVNG